MFPILFREQINHFEICEKLHIQLEKCRNKLYEYIKEDTPAMKNIPYIINKPTWMKEPLWFENIKKMKRIIEKSYVNYAIYVKIFLIK
ncbi:hypothetical protein C923_03858 [Plasmodium falciparum UGT5.1]|uniref:Uncharacterized protein n=1 Tax=Plasmodium falciparum UGT5.1 TaxID=1237627 RepID=W7JV69_PLAFA|nr:hypothetical protein C923_03858 [Plasmodium falciparum UGT5.1]